MVTVSLDELRNAHTGRAEWAQAAESETRKLAPDHREYLADGDLVCDLEELSDRVIDELGPITDSMLPAVHYGMFRAVVDVYTREGDPLGDDPVPDVDYVIAACECAGIDTPY